MRYYVYVGSEKYLHASPHETLGQLVYDYADREWIMTTTGMVRTGMVRWSAVTAVEYAGGLI